MMNRVLFGRISAVVLLCAASVSLVTIKRATAEGWRIVDVKPNGRVHLRDRATSRSRILAYIPGDARGLKSHRCGGSWCQIEFRGLKGWVYKRYLAPDDDVSLNAAISSGTQSGSDVNGKTFMARLSEAKKLRVFNPIGQPVPVYAFPSETLPIAGRLNDGVSSVEGLGACIKGWCYIRSGPLIGWLPTLLLAPANEGGDDGSKTTAAITASLSEQPLVKNDAALNATTTTATTAAIDEAETDTPGFSENGNKLYTLAGLAGKQALPVYTEADDESEILGRIEQNATQIEGLRKCIEKWCLVRWGKLRGWVARRHLADQSVEKSQIFTVTGLPLWTPLKVVDRPGGDADVIGEIPSYATGITPIGGCDENWCHVRYLGIAGWVSGKNLKPQSR